MNYFLLTILMLISPIVEKPTKNAGMIDFLREYLSIRYADKSFDKFIYVAAKTQKLYLISEDELLLEFEISTAKNGIGNNEGSLKTPTGLHKIADMVGEEVQLYEIIKQKAPTGNLAELIIEPLSSNEDIITTRILHLSGLEEGVNKGRGIDSYLRGIFIHGTHEEGLIGSPASKGCIRMKNKEIIELFEQVEVGTFVIILNN